MSKKYTVNYITVPHGIKLPVLMSGTQTYFHVGISPVALHAIYAAKLSYKTGYWAALRYAEKHNVPAGLFSLACMCEGSIVAKEN